MERVSKGHGEDDHSEREHEPGQQPQAGSSMSDPFFMVGKQRRAACQANPG